MDIARLNRKASGAAVGDFTPQEAEYREEIPVDRMWEGDALVGTPYPAVRMHRHPDGTLDFVRLDQDGTHYFDTGGQVSAEFKAGRL